LRLEQLTLQIAGEELSLPFHERLTVVSGIGAAERLELVDMVVGALAGGLATPAEVHYVDATGLRVRAVSDGNGSVRHLAEDGSPVADVFRSLQLDTEGLRRLSHFGAADLGLLSIDIGAPEPPELVEARQALAAMTEELEQAVLARDTAEALRADLEEMEDRLRHLKEGEAKRRYARLLVQLQQVRAEAAAVRGGSEAADTHHRLIAGAADVRRLAQRWRRASVELAGEVEAFGDRERLDPRALDEALGAPADVPVDLERLATAYEEIEAERLDLEAKLQNWTIDHLPKPSHPAVVRLGRIDQRAVWEAARAAVEATRQLEEISLSLGGIEGDGGSLAAVELESAHDAVEAAEQLGEKRRGPAIIGGVTAVVIGLFALLLAPVLALVAFAAAAGVAAWAIVLPPKALARAEQQEQEVLTRHGIPSYLAFHMRRIQATLEPATRESLEVATHEHRRAMNHWADLGGDLAPEDAIAMEKEIRDYAEALGHLEGSGAAVEETRRRLVEEVEPAMERARRKLLRACKPFGVEDLDIAVPMVRHQAAAAVTARLQRSLEAAEQEAEGLHQKLDARLAELGFDDGDVDARLGGFEWALSTAEERLKTRDHARPLEDVEAELARLESEVRREARPEWDANVSPADAEEPDAIELQARRDDAHGAWTAAARLVPDVRRITDRHSAVERRVSVLEAKLEGAGVTGRVTTREIEPQLQARLAAVRRPSSHDETIPLLVDEALLRLDSEVKWSMLDMLERCSAQVQMVYLTDDPEVVTWARRRVGADALSLLEPTADVVL
jgi:uncharacterized protein YhaN